MNFDSFFDQAEKNNLTIEVDSESISYGDTLGNEALFQLPLISLIILLLSKDKRKPFVSEIGQLVGECIEISMPGFKGSSQHIGWSANLRVRCVKALSFLECAELVLVHNRKGRIAITPLGKKLVNKAINNDDNLSYNLAHIARSYRNICVSKSLEMELK